jgi:flavin-binding protein dodecin
VLGFAERHAGAGSARPAEIRVWEASMATARVTKITSSSKKGFQESIEDGLKRASATLRNITGLEVTDLKAKVEKGKITEYRTTMEITFVLE